jgi:hypothetical protein
MSGGYNPNHLNGGANGMPPNYGASAGGGEGYRRNQDTLYQSQYPYPEYEAHVGNRVGQNQPDFPGQPSNVQQGGSHHGGFHWTGHGNSNSGPITTSHNSNTMNPNLITLGPARSARSGPDALSSAMLQVSTIIRTSPTGPIYMNTATASQTGTTYPYGSKDPQRHSQHTSPAASHYNNGTVLSTSYDTRAQCHVPSPPQKQNHAPVKVRLKTGDIVSFWNVKLCSIDAAMTQD